MLRPSSPIVREERVFYGEHFFGETFDFRSRVLFCRYDACVFVDCKFFFNEGTEQLAFTGCTFKDCNIDCPTAFAAPFLVFRDNFFDRPIAVRKAEFDKRLEDVLRARQRPL